MGILDNVTAAVNRGTGSAGRAAEKLKINNQINEITKRRQQLAAQLGASLYDVTKDDAKLREGREALYDGIAACDNERAACQAKLNELEAMSQAAAAAAATLKCSVCGATMSGSDLFCSGCGTPAAQAIGTAGSTATAAANGPKCAKCGAAMNEGDVFCMSCGAKAEPPEKSETSAASEQAPVADSPTATQGGAQ